jgi:hypothetical protein
LPKSYHVVCNPPRTDNEPLSARFCYSTGGIFVSPPVNHFKPNQQAGVEVLSGATSTPNRPVCRLPIPSMLRLTQPGRVWGKPGLRIKYVRDRDHPKNNIAGELTVYRAYTNQSISTDCVAKASEWFMLPEVALPSSAAVLLPGRPLSPLQ